MSSAALAAANSGGATADQDVVLWNSGDGIPGTAYLKLEFGVYMIPTTKMLTGKLQIFREDGEEGVTS